MEATAKPILRHRDHWSSLKAFEHDSDTRKHQWVHAALKCHDYRTMKFDWYVEEQGEEEANASGSG